MKDVRSLVFALSIGAASLAAIGCSGTVEQPQTASSAASKAPIAQSAQGVVKMFGEALGDVALRPAQRAELEKLALAADQRHATMADGKKELMLALADQIERGSIDKAALQPKMDRMVADLEKASPDDIAALARMHAILEPDQRNAFVDALEARFKEGKGKHRGEQGEHAGGGQADGGPHGPTGGVRGLKQLSDDLALTDDQKAKIADAMRAAREADTGAHHGMRGHHLGEGMREGKRALEAFRGEKFDPSVAAPPPDRLRARASEGSTRMLGFAEAVLPILTPEQRRIAADKVRTMASSGAPMPFGH